MIRASCTRQQAFIGRTTSAGAAHTSSLRPPSCHGTSGARGVFARAALAPAVFVPRRRNDNVNNNCVAPAVAQFHSTTALASVSPRRKAPPKVVIKTPFEQVEESIQDHTFHGRWESAWEAYVQCRTNPEVLASLPPLHPECPSTVAVGSLDHLHESFSLKTYSALLRSCHKAMKLQESWFVFATARDTHTVQLDIEFYHQMMDVFRDFEMEKNVIQLYDDLSRQEPHPIKKMIPPTTMTLHKAFFVTAGWEPLLNHVIAIAERVEALFQFKDYDKERVEGVKHVPIDKIFVPRRISSMTKGRGGGGAKAPKKK